MAGIAGWIANGRRPADESALGEMAAVLAHRHGNDELSGVVDTDGRRQVVLGAALHDEASGIALALDGSIANAAELRAALGKRGYAFSGTSSHEVLLRAYQQWDKDVVKHLRGAFAFAVWDARKDRLLLARDRFGEKPLFLHERDGALFFASEPKALLKAGVAATVDVRALRDCLAHRYVPGPRTLFAGIRKLAPATYGLWHFGKLREVRYWVAPDRNPPVSNDKTADPIGGFVEVMEEAVPTGGALLLSGGIDSAVLAALMTKDGTPIRTYSLGFEGDKASELPPAAALAKHYATRHAEIVIAPRELLPMLPKLVAQRDAPLSRPAELAAHRLASEAARTTKTVISGEGCDEVLGGYRRYVAQLNHVPMRLFAPLVSAGRFDTASAELKLNGWGDALLNEKGESGENLAGADPRASALRRALYADQTSWLPDQVLESAERAAAAASLEARMPFLDHRVAEYVSSLPDEQRVRGFTTKWILRQAARRLIPAQLRRRPKAGWRLDVASWLRNDLRDFTLDHLQGRSSVTRPYYDAVTLDRVLEEHLKGKKNYETLLWTLLNIEIWHRTYTPG